MTAAARGRAGAGVRVYRRVVSTRTGDRSSLPPDAVEHVESNGLRLLAALSFTKLGDRLVDAKTVLPWLLAAGGAPAGFVGLLVPVRESGSLLPQVALLGVVRRRARRVPLWLLGAGGQAAAAGGMAASAAVLSGVALGVAVLGALAVFAVSRAVCSLTVKDVLGRTVPKGERGGITGVSESVSGLVAIGVGLALRAVGPDGDVVAFVSLLTAGAVMWVAAAAVFGGLREPRAEVEPHGGGSTGAAVRDALTLLRTDAPFRGFVLVRTLLLVSALTPPFVVALASERTGSSAAGLGAFVVAAGLAAFVGGRVWGGAADRSSRRVMALAAGLATAVVVVFLALLPTGLGDRTAFFVVAYTALAVVHTGARVGRSTYVVDLAGGDRRTDHVAVSNTVIGVVLLVVGGVTSALAQLGAGVALAALAALGALCVPLALRLPEVEGR